MTDQDLEQIRAVMRDVLAPIEFRLNSLEQQVAGLQENAVTAWRHLSFMRTRAQQQIAEAKKLEDFQRRTDIKLEEIYTSMATSAEIIKLREEVAESTERERALELRIGTIEMHLGLSNPLLPE